MQKGFRPSSCSKAQVTSLEKTAQLPSGWSCLLKVQSYLATSHTTNMLYVIVHSLRVYRDVWDNVDAGISSVKSKQHADRINRSAHGDCRHGFLHVGGHVETDACKNVRKKWIMWMNCPKVEVYHGSINQTMGFLFLLQSIWQHQCHSKPLHPGSLLRC